jgi:hypothetical protein
MMLNPVSLALMMEAKITSETLVFSSTMTQLNA